MYQNNKNELSDEAITILSYIIKKKPNDKLINLYIESIIKTRNGSSISIPKIYKKFPFLLFQFDNKNLFKKQYNEFDSRILTALCIAETSTINVDKFILNKKQNFFLVIIKILFFISFELIMIIFKILLNALTSVFFNNNFKNSLK
ncbi:hypothetical protein N8X83_01225 [Alphaproteobacteria bacterium]|nr:hypothetical protein [Alphaproteobacteria bacterium]